MKKWLVYLLGVLTGIVLTLAFVFFVGSTRANNTETLEEQVENDNNITWFDEPGDIVDEKSYKVLQVISQDAALVNAQSYSDLYTGTVYLITNDEGKYYYDDQIIKAPTGKVIRQIGIYRYETRTGYITVPIIMIMDK